MFIVFFLTFLHVPFPIVYNFDFILLVSNQGVGANGLLGQAGAQVLYLLNIL